MKFTVVKSLHKQRWPRLVGQNEFFLKWRLAMFCLCGGAPCRQVVKVHVIRCVPVKRPMRPCLVVKRQVALQCLVSSADGLVGAQIDLLIFDAFPESFYEEGGQVTKHTGAAGSRPTSGERRLELTEPAINSSGTDSLIIPHLRA